MTPRLSVVTWLYRRPGVVGPFGAVDVNRMRAMLERHLHLEHDFIVFTDDSTGFDPRIRAEPLPRLFEDPAQQASSDFRCRRRLWQYDRARVDVLGPRALFIDLDMILVGDITALVARPDPVVALWMDYAKVYSPALLLCDTGALHGLWETYRADPIGYPAATGQANASDLAMLNHWLRGKPKPAKWDAADGVVVFFGRGYERHAHHGISQERPQLPPTARIVVFGSADKAFMENGPAWLREHWSSLA